MNTRMMFARDGDECCQCENVANTKSNSQFSGDIAAADQLGIGNIGTGNTSTMATLNKMNQDEVRSEVAEIDLKIVELKKRRKELLAVLGEGSLSWGMLILGGFGALMIGLGVIALFAANWDEFGREARAAIALAPVVACGATAVWARSREVKSSALWESLGVFWCVSVAAAACLVAQTYQVGGSVPGLVLLVAFLMLPVIWVTSAATPMALWPILPIVWVFTCREAGASKSVALAAKGVALMAVSLPAYIAFLRSRPAKAALLSVQVVTGLVYSLGLGILLVEALPVRISYGHESAFVCVFWGCAALVAAAGFAFSLPAWGIVGAVIAAGATFPTPFFECMPTYVVALLIASGIIAYGVAKLRLGFANVGAVALLWLVLAKFFESDLPFTLKGLTLIGSGVAFVMLNVVLVRIRKGRRA